MSYILRDPFLSDPFFNSYGGFGGYGTHSPFSRDPFFRDPFMDMDRLMSRMMSEYDQPMLTSGQQQQQQSQVQTSAEKTSEQAGEQQQGGQLQQQQPQLQQMTCGGASQLSPFMRGIPRLDVTETDKSYVIHADLPGINKEEVNINIKDDMLNISGERRSSSEQVSADNTRRLVERGYGRFSRSVRLPMDADAENVAAKMENGVLELCIAKRETGQEEQGTKKITIA
ncbi:hypothetical protein HDU97_003118 [Phlyctochytrium planicorne]|nr:hypothetical protein HDU97_003069 [Phlyctochytrium planicorne]KAJ3109689.1 hypothetical protein HDU97_003118 [Phlyctochytrium planicorne]